MSLYIVATFLLLTLVVGIYFSKRKTTFQEYAIGNKQFSTATLVATILATFFGGSGLVNNVECVHQRGLWWIVFLLTASCGFWIISRLVLHMGPFMQHLSIAETIGTVYGKYSRVITALISICSSIIAITVQINVMSKAIGMCVHTVDSKSITIVSALILIFYSASGGIRAITFTDALQFITFAIIIPLLCWFMFVKAGKPAAEIIPLLQNHAKFQFNNLLGFQLISVLLLILCDLAASIDIPIIQRIYMTSSPIQAQKAFSYATIFSIVIITFIILVGLFVFVVAPELEKSEIWGYIVAHISPVFKGFIAIGLIAMSMSTADSYLNTCAIMVSHDILESIRNTKAAPYVHKLLLARYATLTVGSSAMILAFYYKDLLQLLYLSIECYVPIAVAPFILAIFGFRGTSRTALIGMVIGVLTILAWNKWVEPSIETDGSFFAMVANGLAMMATHYLLKQPEDAGWIKPDNEFQQVQQERAHKRADRKETIKNSWGNRKMTLTKLIPSDTTLRSTGLYMITTTILGYWFIRPDRIYWAIFKGFLGVLFTSSKMFLSKRIPTWLIGLGWLIGLTVYLPINIISNWFHSVNPIFTASLSLTHYAIILWVLPLHLAIGVLALVSIYPIVTGFSFLELSSLFPLFIASLLVFAMAIWFKVKQNRHITQILYLKDQEKVRTAQKLKTSLYDSVMVPTTAIGKTKGYGSILAQVVRKIEESISFLDNNTPLYKQDFQGIIHKLYDWVVYFNRREKAKQHALLQPNKISLDKLIRKVELALSQEIHHPPRLLVEKKES